jgi:hypothetical protein
MFRMAILRSTVFRVPNMQLSPSLKMGPLSKRDVSSQGSSRRSSRWCFADALGQMRLHESHFVEQLADGGILVKIGVAAAQQQVDPG